MRLRAVALTGLVLLAAAGCGGASSRTKAERRQATQYLQRIDLVQERMRPQLLRASKAYRHFSTRPDALRREQAQFAHAAASFTTLRRRLARVAAPPVVRELRTRMLRLVDAETSLAGELSLFARFLPQFRDALAPLAGANSRLAKSLAAIKTPRPKSVPRSQLRAARTAYEKVVAAAAVAQAAAVTAYVAQVATIGVRVRALHPPTVLAPVFGTQVLTLERVQASGRALAAALQSRAYPKVAALDRSFRAAALGTTTLAAQRAERAAIRSYDARVKRVGVLSTALSSERARLQKVLG